MYLCHYENPERKFKPNRSEIVENQKSCKRGNDPVVGKIMWLFTEDLILQKDDIGNRCPWKGSGYTRRNMGDHENLPGKGPEPIERVYVDMRWLPSQTWKRLGVVRERHIEGRGRKTGRLGSTELKGPEGRDRSWIPLDVRDRSRGREVGLDLCKRSVIRF